MKKRTFNLGKYQYTITSKKIEEPDSIALILEEILKLSNKIEQQRNYLDLLNDVVTLTVEKNQKITDILEGDKKGVAQLVNQVSAQIQELKTLVYAINQGTK